MTRPSSFLPLIVALLMLSATVTASSEEADETAAAEETSDGTESASSQEGGANDALMHNFRLFARRPIGLRLFPNVGLRMPLLAPIFLPKTADFRDLEDAEGPFWALSLSLSFFSVDGERDSFKGQEFRDLSGDISVGVDTQWRDASNWLRLTGRHLGLDDRDLELEWRRFGLAKTQLRLNRIPHRFAFDAPTLYTGIGSEHLALSDEIQQTLDSSTSLIDAADRLRAFVAGAGLTDVDLVRDRKGVQIDLTAFHPWAIKLKIDDESRQGARPWSGTFGLANFVEIPWPVDYDLRNIFLETEYAAGSTLVRGSFYVSEFDNRKSTVSFDNPWRASDSTGNGAIFDIGPESGLIDLYPSNEQQELTFTLAKNKLPAKSTLQATVAWNRMQQDDPLVPYTTNTAIVPGAAGRPPFDASDAANLPLTSADAELTTQLIHLQWKARPTDRLSLKLHFRDQQLDNKSARIFSPGYALEDTVWRRFFGTTDGAFTNLPIAHDRTSYGVELGIRLRDKSRLTLAVEHEEVDRDFLQVEHTDEDRFKLSFDSKPAPWVDLRASWSISDKTASEVEFDAFFTDQGIGFVSALPLLSRFDQVARERQRLQLMANFYPHESLILTTQAIHGEDDYPETIFGLQRDDHAIYALDLSYAASERLSFFVAYSYEEYDVRLRGREWSFNGPGDPFRQEPGEDSASNWTARPSDQIDTLTFGLEADLIPDKLHLQLAFASSKSDGTIRYDSPIGDFDANPFDPADFTAVDDVTFYSLSPELEYELMDSLALSLVYLREKYEIRDFNSAGLVLVPTTAGGEFNGGLLIGSLPKDFNLDVLALKLKASF